ncbi:MAG: DUF3015 family protein [Deltaproteobacteria bacterium]|nr:MAG: DUF3015 family protein [Deltaproteobacteria bacterium]
MKKSIVVVSAMCLALAASGVQAAGKKKSVEKQISGQAYGMSGCGLGSIIFGDDNGKVQIFAATTNGTFGNQTFGITSGTSNCNPENGNRADNLNVYVEANRLALANDVSRGSGETVEGLSQIVGCKDSKALSGKLQKDYGRIFPSQNVPAEEVSQSIMKSIASDKALASTCHS